MKDKECKHEWAKWEVKEDDICIKCGKCASEVSNEKETVSS